MSRLMLKLPVTECPRFLLSQSFRSYYPQPPVPARGTWEKVTLNTSLLSVYHSAQTFQHGLKLSPAFLRITQAHSLLTPHSLQQFKFFRASLSFVSSTHLSIRTLFTHLHWLAVSTVLIQHWHGRQANWSTFLCPTALCPPVNLDHVFHIFLFYYLMLLIA